jgi:urease accessory protein
MEMGMERAISTGTYPHIHQTKVIKQNSSKWFTIGSQDWKPIGISMPTQNDTANEMASVSSPSPYSTPAQSAKGWHGRLDLDFVYQQGKTLVHRSQAQAPLKFQRPFYPEGDGVCHGVMLHTAGGIVGGDRLSLQISLGEESHAFLTTAAATKLYRSTGATSVQATRIALGSGACLEWFPQEVIVFNGGRYHQHTHVELAEGAVWMGWELARLGRSARRESFQKGEWRSHTEIWRNGVPLWIDRQFVTGGSAMLQNPQGLGGCPVIGSFALVGTPIASDIVDTIRKQWDEYVLSSILSPPSAGNTRSSSCRESFGVSRLANGVLCRYRGTSTLQARRLFLTAWDVVRANVMNTSPHRPRVWSI